MTIAIGDQTFTGSATINGVECLELVAEMEEGIDDRGPYATKRYLCEWAKRYALANGFLGYVTHTGGQSGSVQIAGPLAYPESANMLARAVRIQGVGKPTQGTRQLQFTGSVVTVDFGVPTWQAIPYPDMSIDPTTPFVYATQDIRFTREMLAIPNSALYLKMTASPFTVSRMDDTPYATPIPNAVFNINIHRVPFLPAAAIFTAMKNPLNNATFLGIPAGYLRFDGADNHGEASSDGTFTQSLAFQFTARSRLRWDETYNKTGEVCQILLGGSAGPAVLGRSDFRALIPSNYYGNP
jgi:hypothetical protein